MTDLGAEQFQEHAQRHVAKREGRGGRRAFVSYPCLPGRRPNVSGAIQCGVPTRPAWDLYGHTRHLSRPSGVARQSSCPAWTWC